MLLSIIIVNFRGWKRLRQCLDSIQNQNPEAEKIEVIVVDNQSADGQLEIFKNQFPEFIFFENSGNCGFAHGCNLGASLAKGTNYLFLNPDTILNTAALNGLIQLTSLLSEKVMLSCTQLTDNGKDTHPYGYFLNLKTLNPLARSLRSFMLGKPKTITLASGHHAISPEWISGSLILISKINFNTLGGWNQDYWMYFEDMDLCKRFNNLGGSIYLVTDFSVIHNHGGASRINAETRALTKAEVMISRHVYVQKHLSGISNLTSQIYLVINNLFFEPLLLALAGLILFFNPKVFTYTIRYFNVLNYYLNALRNNSWLSPRSINFHS